MTILNSFSQIRSRVTQLKHTLDGCFGFSYFALLCATPLCWQAYSRVKQSFIKNTVTVCSTARLCILVDFLYLLMKIQSATTISSPFSDFLLDIISVFSRTQFHNSHSQFVYLRSLFSIFFTGVRDQLVELKFDSLWEIPIEGPVMLMKIVTVIFVVLWKNKGI